MNEVSSSNNTPMSPKPSIFTGVSPKLTFIMGLVTGVAVISLVGWVLASVPQLAGKRAALLGNVAGTSGNDTSSTPPAAPTLPGKVDIQVKPGDYIRGDQNAPVTLVEYSDLECPFCKRFHPSMQQLLQEYPGKVRWIYRHFPLSFHVNAQKEAEAAECVGKLGGNDKFWTYLDKIFERTTSNGTGFALADLPKLAREVGVAEANFKACLDSGEFAAKVQADFQEGASFGVNGTPTTFVNGQAVEGAVPYEQLKAVVEQVLNQ